MSDFKSYASEKELKKLGSYIIFDKETGDVKRIIFPNSIREYAKIKTKNISLLDKAHLNLYPLQQFAFFEDHL